MKAEAFGDGSAGAQGENSGTLSLPRAPGRTHRSFDLAQLGAGDRGRGAVAAPGTVPGAGRRPSSAEAEP